MWKHIPRHKFWISCLCGKYQGKTTDLKWFKSQGFWVGTWTKNIKHRWEIPINGHIYFVEGIELNGEFSSKPWCFEGSWILDLISGRGMTKERVHTGAYQTWEDQSCSIQQWFVPCLRWWIDDVDLMICMVIVKYTFIKRVLRNIILYNTVYILINTVHIYIVYIYIQYIIYI